MIEEPQSICTTPKERKSLPTRGINGSTRIWMEEKVQRDKELYNEDSSKYWIVENKLYDLSSFIDKHPGGSSWISKTKGQDITEHFIIHHLNEEYARSVLNQYYIRNCQQKVQRFTFEENGLYRTIKKEVLKQITPKQIQNEWSSQVNGIILLFVFFCCLGITALYSSYYSAILCSVLLIGIVGIAHNFVHHKESPFRYFFLLTGFTHHEWQVMHCISHHIYPNTELDYEIGAFEPFAYFLRNSPNNKIYTKVMMEVLFILVIPINILLKLIIIPVIKLRRPDLWYMSTLACLILFYICNRDLWMAVKLYLFMYGLFGCLLMKVLFCGHRLQELWTEGAAKIEDFGEHTILATSDTDIIFEGMLSFVMFAGFNIHVAHHLFPTADHSKLPDIMKIVVKICKEKGVKYTQKNRLECMKSIYAGLEKRIPFSLKNE